jgi:hypothetical protein
LRLWAGYGGAQFAEGKSWRHGAILGVGWYKLAPLFIGASLLITPPVEVPVKPAGEEFNIGRVPIGAHVGYRHSAGPVRLDLEIGLLLEVLYSDSPESERPEVDITQKAPEVLVGFSPRVRGELGVLPWASFFAALGGDLFLNDVVYIVQVDGEPETLLEPARLRLVAEAGLAFYL